jgi:hypothetical protein
MDVDCCRNSIGEVVRTNSSSARYGRWDRGRRKTIDRTLFVLAYVDPGVTISSLIYTVDETFECGKRDRVRVVSEISDGGHRGLSSKVVLNGDTVVPAAQLLPYRITSVTHICALRISSFSYVVRVVCR